MKTIQHIFTRIIKIFFILFLILQTLYSKSQTMQEIKSVSAFVYENENTPYGTCFFVGIRSIKYPERSYIYLVTAKHVLQDEKGEFLKRILVKLNKKDSGAVFTFVDINPRNVYFHSDQTIDLAVVQISVNMDIYDVKWIEPKDFLTKEQFKFPFIQEGTEVFFAGLFTNYIGEKKIYPIMRFGRIALITDEKIDFVNKKSNFILIESSAYGGNSGSPVYFTNGTIGFKLGGVLNGVFNDIGLVYDRTGQPEQLVDKDNLLLNLRVKLNNGISVITPIYYLNDILNSPALSKQRD